MMKFLSFCTAATCLLAGCAQTPNADGQQQRLSRVDREETTGSMLPRRKSDPGAAMSGGQIDPSQILNPGANQAPALSGTIGR